MPVAAPRCRRRRIVQNLDAIKAADVIICITGMDGGLASVVAGMVEVPVIALPTSTGGWCWVGRWWSLVWSCATCLCGFVGVQSHGTRRCPPLLPAPPWSPPAGYGTAFGGTTPLLAALNSSAPGVTVVNIDSGFGASMAAWRILKNVARIRQAALAAAAAPRAQ